MNAERLHAIALAVRSDLDQTGVVGVIGVLRDALKNQVGAPQEPSYQQAVSTTLQQLQSALSAAQSNTFPATWIETLEELGAAGLLGAALRQRVTEVFERNQITPSVAAEEVETIAAELQALDTAIDQLLASFDYFDVQREELAPGEVEVSVLIPRAEVREELRRLGEEFVELQKILGPFLELATGSRPPVHVRTMSSSNYSVFLEIAPKAAAFVAIAVERVVALYKSLLEIRKLRQDLADAGVPEAGLAGVDTHANEHMRNGIDVAADEMLASISVKDASRKNELSNELRGSMNAIANRIDRGYNIDVRAALPVQPEPTDGETPAVKDSPDIAALRRIAELSPNLKFINRVGAPILSLPEVTNPPDAPKRARAAPNKRS